MARRILQSSAFLGLMLLGWVPVVQAQTCDDTTRAQFQADVDAGVPDSVLESRYGHCRQSVAPGSGAKTISFLSSNTSYERMNGCGYHPQSRLLACDVEIRRNTWYGPFGAAPLGSFERVRFCLDCTCDGAWDFQTVGSVHVTNAVAGAGSPPWYHLAFATVPTAVCPPPANGARICVRTILAWQAVPPVCANVPITSQPRPIWGNLGDWQARRDP